jgi:hypothetical protein
MDAGLDPRRGHEPAVRHERGGRSPAPAPGTDFPAVRARQGARPIGARFASRRESRSRIHDPKLFFCIRLVMEHLPTVIRRA